VKERKKETKKWGERNGVLNESGVSDESEQELKCVSGVDLKDLFR
jgi:hypothetical protein